MDWSKAKNILIIAFILTNIFLAYVLFTIDKGRETISIQDEFIEDVVGLLEKQAIRVDAEVPKNIPSLPTISVEYEAYDIPKVLGEFLGSYTGEMINGKKTYVNGKRNVYFGKNDKKISYRNENIERDSSETLLTKDEAIKKSEDFIISHGFKLDDARLNYIVEKEGAYELEYNKLMGDIVIEETHMKIEISSKGLIAFERYWIQNIEEENRMLSPTSAPKALLRLLARDEYYGKTIKKIDLCYYFNVDAYKENVPLDDSTGGIAVPTWRFVFEDGEKVFLEEN